MRYARLLIIFAVLLTGSPVQAATRNCDANAMIYCGAYSKDELIRKMTQGDGHHNSANIRELFNRYHVKPSDVRSSATVNGEVRKDGTVWVGGKKVAINAYSYGRQNLSGSTKQGTLYKRPTSVSFESSSLPAYVHTTGGKFDWAIIKSCGNMVTATPIIPAPKATKALAQPAPVVHQTVVQQVVQQNIVQAPPPAVKPLPKALPQTGTEASGPQLMIAIVGISISFGLLLYSRQRVRNKLALTA